MNYVKNLQLFTESVVLSLSLCVAPNAHATLLGLSSTEFVPVQTIDFSEVPLGTVNPVYVFDSVPSIGSVTVSFGGHFLGQSTTGGFPVSLADTSPTSTLSLDPNSPITKTANDGAPGATSPILSGSPTFNGPISVLFSSPVAGVALKGGYFDRLNSTSIEAFRVNGSSLGYVKNSSYGFETFGLADSTNANVISGISFYISGDEPAGFGIDNLTFGYEASTKPKRSQITTSDILPDKPTVIVTHGIQPGADYQAGILPETTQKIVDNLSALYGNTVNIIPFHWEDAYSKSENITVAFDEARPFIDNNGRRLSALLENKLGKDYTGTLQFIGHSAGTLVNAYAANYLTENTNINIDQFTMLDAPLDQTGYYPISFYQVLPDSPRLRYVDNYYGPFPVAFGDELDGAYNDFLLKTHGGIHEWYADTIEAAPTGGFQYSILRGESIFGNRPSPQQWSNPADEANVTIISLVDDITNIDIDQIGNNCRRTGGILPIYQCEEHSPAWLPFELTIPEDAIFLSFDFKFGNGGDGDWLSVLFDDVLLYSVLGENFEGDGWVHADLPVDILAGSTGLLTFRLNSVGAANATLELANMAFMGLADEFGVPEPGTITMFLLGLWGIRCSRRQLSAFEKGCTKKTKQGCCRSEYGVHSSSGLRDVVN